MKHKKAMINPLKGIGKAKAKAELKKALLLLDDKEFQRLKKEIADIEQKRKKRNIK